MSENGRLSAKQEALLLALVSGQGIEEAAKTAGVSARSAYRWQKLEAFQEELKRVKDETFERHLGILKEGIITVLLTLRRNMAADAPPAVQVSAAKCWLETAIMLYKADQLETKIDSMEAALKEFGGGSFVSLQ